MASTEQDGFLIGNAAATAAVRQYMQYNIREGGIDRAGRVPHWQCRNNNCSTAVQAVYHEGRWHRQSRTASSLAMPEQQLQYGSTGSTSSGKVASSCWARHRCLSSAAANAPPSSSDSVSCCLPPPCRTLASFKNPMSDSLHSDVAKHSRSRSICYQNPTLASKRCMRHIFSS